MRIAPLRTSCFASQTDFCRPTPSRKPSTTSWTPPDRPTALQRLDFWLDACDRLELPEFKSCRKTLLNWKPYILNAFDFRLSNGFTEGCNNAIKTLKRVAFGFRNFRSFRARILLSLSPYPNI